MARDAEIEQVARELAILPARYEPYRRNAGIVKVFFMNPDTDFGGCRLGFRSQAFPARCRDTKARHLRR